MTDRQLVSRDEPNVPLFDSLPKDSQYIIGSPEEDAYADSVDAYLLSDRLVARIGSEDPAEALRAITTFLKAASTLFSEQVLGLDGHQTRDLMTKVLSKPPHPIDDLPHDEGSSIGKAAVFSVPAGGMPASSVVGKMAELGDVGSGLGTDLQRDNDATCLLESAGVLAQQTSVEASLYAFEGVIKHAHTTIFTIFLDALKTGREISPGDFQTYRSYAQSMPRNMTFKTLRFKGEDLVTLKSYFPEAER